MEVLKFSCYKSYIYLLVFWILDISTVVVRDLYLEKEISDIENNKGTEFIYISCLSLADLFAGFLVFHTYRKMKSINKSEKDKEKEQKKEKLITNNKRKKDKRKKITYELIYNDYSIKRYKYIYLFFISLLEFIARSTDLLYLLILKNELIRPGEINWLISIDIFSRIIFSRIILKSKIYKHHIFSLILIICGLCSMSICAFKAIADHELNSWPYFLFIVGKYLILPFEDVINKILLTDQFLLPHYLMFWRGFFNLFMLIILGCSVIIPGYVKFVYFNQFNTLEDFVIQILVKVLFTIFSFCKAFCLLKVIDIFSPQHVSFLNTAFSLYQLIKCRIKAGDDIVLTVLDGFFLVIIIFSTLVFNEILIINAFGLSENTKEGFLKKEKDELSDIKLNCDEDEEESKDEDIEKSNSKINDSDN